MGNIMRLYINIKSADKIFTLLDASIGVYFLSAKTSTFETYWIDYQVAEAANILGVKYSSFDVSDAPSPRKTMEGYVYNHFWTDLYPYYLSSNKRFLIHS